MAQKATGNIRMGIVSFITLVSVLLLAVLSVLCIVTANATRATAQRQAESVTGLYAADAEGQRFLAAVDSYLVQSKQAGESAQAAVKRIVADTDGTLAQAMAQGGAAAEQGGDKADSEVLTYSFTGEGRTLYLTVTHRDGRVLQASMSIDDDLDCVVDTWATSTAQAGSSEALWSSSNAGDADGATQGADNKESD